MASKKKQVGDGAGAPKRRKKNPKGMPKALSPGIVLTDLRKKKWKLGNLIGQGGFGYLYLGSDVDVSATNEEKFVIKVEPHSNGPLFVELAFYQRAAKPELISSWIKEQGLKYLGVPLYLGSGSFDQDDIKYRFLVMERFSEDVDKKFLVHGRMFSLPTVLSLGLAMVNCLEYIHEQEYVHADIKGSNILTGYDKKTKDSVYLVDYGLAFRYCPNGTHVKYKEDPKRMHDGTIEYTSRDAHKGAAPSRRGDLEILGYCMVHWLCGYLPWEGKLEDKVAVFLEKQRFMEDISKSLKTCKKRNCESTAEIEEYLKYINNLQYEEKPDYKRVRTIFQKGLKRQGISFDGKNVLFKAAATLQKPSKIQENKDVGITKGKKPSVPTAKQTITRSSPRKRKGEAERPSGGVRTPRIVKRTRKNLKLEDKATSP